MVFFAPKHILVPIAIDPDDDVKLAKHALGVACDMARKFNAKITLLHLTTPIMVGSAPGMDITGKIYESFLAIMENNKLQGKLKLQELEQAAKAQGLNIESRVIDGLESTANAIIDVGHKIKADLIVIGSHGRSGLAKLLYGSVAESLAAKAHIPLLLLHPHREI